jgi:antibiotic biosynthesis monooxygenase (ABM) superfamily enzyme
MSVERGVVAADASGPALQAGVTIVTQTCPALEHRDAFAAWQRETSRIIAGFEGFVRQTVLPPNPPAQVDWLILQHFETRAAAQAWLSSPERLARVAAVQPLVTGRDDVHVVTGDGVGSGPVSAVISTRVRAGHEAAYRQWEQRMAQVQARAPGFQGYRLEPPIEGIQDDWLAIVRFDSQHNLQRWLDSPARAALLKDGEALMSFRLRTAQAGFDQWFASPGKAASVPAWKQNMVVLMLLYPVVFLFGAYVQVPILQARLHMPFPVALFVGNVVGIILLNYLVPWTSQRFGWWLGASSERPATALGVGMVLAAYAVMIGVFTWVL